MRCIAYVPQRGGRDAPFVPEHRCRYEAHAHAWSGVPVCNLHAGVRQRRARRRGRDDAQLPLPIDAAPEG